MTTTTQIDKFLKRRSNTIVQCVEDCSFMNGLTVCLKKGKYKGRTGVIAGIVADNEHGMLFLVYVYKKGTKELLNSDRYTRQYHPREDFDFVLREDVREDNETSRGKNADPSAWRTRRK